MSVHVRWGDWTFKLDPESFLRFQAMVEEAARRIQEAAPETAPSQAKRGLWRH